MLFARTRWGLFVWPMLAWMVAAFSLMDSLNWTAVELSALPSNLTIHIVYPDNKTSIYCNGLWDCGTQLCLSSTLPNLSHLHIYPGDDCISGIETLETKYSLISIIFLLSSCIFELTFILIYLIVRYPEVRAKKFLWFLLVLICISISLSYIFQIMWTRSIRERKMDKIPGTIEIFSLMSTMTYLSNIYVSHYSLFTKDRYVIEPL